MQQKWLILVNIGLEAKINKQFKCIILMYAERWSSSAKVQLQFSSFSVD